MANVLIIDDDEGMCYTLSRMVKQVGHNVISKLTIKEGLAELFSSDIDIIFLDLKLPDGNGLDVLPKLLQSSSKPDVIIITGHGDPDGAELAMKHGVWDYIQKPSSIEAMKLPFVRALQYRKEKLKQRTTLFLKRDGIIGDDPEINHCLNMVARAADIDANVLVTGETGTGKELFARAIHENSHRAGNALVVVDCATLPDNLIESTLFGHEKGAFTGASQHREGLIKEADGGTLFLDEVGELPLPQQKAFLRVLQERRFRPVGSKKDTVSNFRVIAATNRNIDEMVQAGTFREDLFFRLQALTINLPSLRGRAHEIKDITSYYITKLADKYGLGQKGYSQEFLNAINTYSWPGNVRELIHAIENALSESRESPTLFPIHLPIYIRSWLAKLSMDLKTMKGSFGLGERNSADQVQKLKDVIEITEKKYLQNLIALTGGDIKEICRSSGLAQSNVYVRFKKYGLSKTSL